MPGGIKMTREYIALCVIILVYISISVCADGESSNRVVSERLIAEIDFSSWIPKTFEVSPDSKRVAYVAKAGDKQVVVVDGEEGKQYDSILEGTPIFSLDSKRVVYGAQIGDKWLVVVDREEGKQYDGILEGTLTFSPDGERIAYIAVVGDITPVYQASATIMARGDPINTVRLKIGSRRYMRDAADKAGVGEYLESVGEPSDVEYVVEYLRDIVTVRSLGSEVFEISVIHQSPGMAKDITNALANTYITRTLQWRQQALTRSLHFITEELKLSRKRLIEAEEALLAAQEKGALDYLSDKDIGLSDPMRQLSKLRTDLVEVELDLREANSELQNAKTLATGNVTEEGYSLVSDRVKALEVKRTELNNRINEYSWKLQQLPQQQVGLARLQHEKQVADSIYSMLLHRLSGLELLRSLELQNMGSVAAILDPATLPDKPVKPDIPHYLTETFTFKGIYLVEETLLHSKS
jgi:hypothetical protein